MGRKTWESIPERFRPFSNRLNIVISRNAGLQLPDGVLLAHSLAESLELAKEKAFIIGGGNIYKQAIEHPKCTELIITEIDAEFDADTFFPEIPEKFSVSKTTEWEEEKGLKFRFTKYTNS